MAGYVVDFIRPDGIEVRINDNNNTFLTRDWQSGIEPPDIAVPMLRKPGLDGAERMGRPYTSPRALGVKWKAVYDSHSALLAYVDQMARQLTPYWSEESDGALRITTPDGRVRQIDAIPGLCATTLDSPYQMQLAQQFRSAQAFFYDPVMAETIIALSAPGGVLFPMVFDPSTGVEFAESDLDGHYVATNGGDAPTWPIVRIYGLGDDPVIENETLGETIDLTGLSLDAGDWVDIDMAGRTIQWWDASSGGSGAFVIALSYRSATSAFFWLAPGDNILHVTMANVTTGSMRVQWYNRYRSGL